MDKQSQIRLRKTVNELFFKKNYQSEKLLDKKEFPGIL